MNVMAFTNTIVFNLFAQRPTACLKGQTWEGNSLAFNGSVVLRRRTLYPQRKRQRESVWGSVWGQLDCQAPVRLSSPQECCNRTKSGGDRGSACRRARPVRKGTTLWCTRRVSSPRCRLGKQSWLWWDCGACQHPQVDWNTYFITVSMI